MTADACIKVERSGALARVEVHQPARRNALRLAMWQQLGEVMTELATDDAVRVAVLTGAGDRAFCAGADISEFETVRSTPEQLAHYDRVSHGATAAMARFPKPLIGRIQGFCVGGGMELAMLCDIRVCNRSARFGVTPARLGIGYTLKDTQLLVDTLGAVAVREILFTGRLFDAGEALAMGMVNRVAGDDELDDLVKEYCDQIAANAPLSIQAAKQIVREATRDRADQDVALCDELIARCFDSADYIEGRRAFAEKRPPRFTGR
jgi:enoyl-CoA hydratase/carnithine racemase